MKTLAETNFSALIRYPFHDLLKHQGYRKKRYSFYRSTQIGKLINIQKSQASTRDQINFTINLGLFSESYWQLLYNYTAQPVPIFPQVSECVLTRRSEFIVDHSDQWYSIDQETVMSELVAQMENNLTQYILPYLDAVKTLDDLLEELGSARYLERIILLATANRMAEAHLVLDQALADQVQKSYKSIVLSRAKDLGLIKSEKLTN
ncbi:DUF4304 domain-containing protein [Spirosoma koreense]